MKRRTFKKLVALLRPALERDSSGFVDTQNEFVVRVEPIKYVLCVCILQVL